jgi:hypothetical protein
MSARSDAALLARSALATIDSSIVLGVVDKLDLRPTPGVNPVSLVPLKSLRQRRDVMTFARTAPVGSVSLMLEILSHDALERVVELLGENAENPTLEELDAAVTGALDADVPNAELLAMLAYAVVAPFSAAAHCRHLLETRSEFALVTLS